MSAQELPGLPAGPIEKEPSGGFRPHVVQERLVLEALTAAGVELGEYDRRIATWLSRWDWTTVAVVASWVQRAVAARPSRAEVLREAWVEIESLCPDHGRRDETILYCCCAVGDLLTDLADAAERGETQ